MDAQCAVTTAQPQNMHIIYICVCVCVCTHITMMGIFFFLGDKFGKSCGTNDLQSYKMD